MRTVLALSAVAVASTAAVEQCSPAALQAAVTPVALSAGAALLKCSEESGLSLDAVADPSTASPAQVEALLKSDSCASFFASVQSAIAKISPPCALVTSPRRVWKRSNGRTRTRDQCDHGRAVHRFLGGACDHCRRNICGAVHCRRDDRGTRQVQRASSRLHLRSAHGLRGSRHALAANSNQIL
ncbi:hypothetical protein ACHHYP_00687 [Achlya hypogyna]|uniref:Secreted protein n=1 Tax=Achlya hypogyna TaxID=1202772 RepID=A0A1V9ZU21_ACHHY|nr:hypothetical protein ACHHYP_00687 [Achlya hypogyna]